MYDPDSVLTLLTYNGVQAAEELVTEMPEYRNLALPHSIDEPFYNETLGAVEALYMERNETNDERH